MLYYVYILSNDAGTVLHTGVTDDLKQLVYEHREKRVPGISNRDSASCLVYFAVCDDESSAIARAKQINAASWLSKTALINYDNPEWRDLYYELA